jgi:hypothetical protein
VKPSPAQLPTTANGRRRVRCDRVAAMTSAGIITDRDIARNHAESMRVIHDEVL